MKEIKKKRKETMRFAGLILHQFQGMSNPDSVHVSNQIEIKSMGIFGF